MKRITIFGATGTTGLCSVEAAIKKSLKIKVLVRDPQKVPESLKAQLDEIIEGDVLNYENVLNALKSTEAVVVALGTRNNLAPTTDLSEGLKNIIRGMKELNLDVISVCLSSFLFQEPNNVPAIFKHINAEHQRMFDVLKDSGLKFIAVYPPHIADQPGTSYQIAHDKSLGRIVSKYDLGQFLIDSLDQSEHYGHIVGIISKVN